ncbi:MAG: hypothetical protein ACOZHQ_02855 [Thermodesulfobacteriota bacterium]
MRNWRVAATILVGLALALLAAAEPAWAAKAQKALPEWRVIWNQVWKILNFLILAFLLVKLAKKPIKDFVSGQKASVAETMAVMEKAKAAALAERRAVEEKTAGLEQELARIEDYLTEQAAREREAMLAEARQEAARIIERAEMLSARALGEARRQLAAEMVEQASVIAEQTLRQAINADDRARLLDDFTRSLTQTGLAPGR